MRSFIFFLLALASTQHINAQNTQNDVFKWAKSITGGPNNSNKIAIDAEGNVYTIGSFRGTANFDPGVTSSNLTSVGTAITSEDVYLRKSDAHGNFLWVKSFGGSSGSGYGVDLALDAAGNILLTGGFLGTLDFDPGSDFFGLTSTYNTANGGYYSTDVFICKLDADGNFIWAKSMGGKKNDYVNGIHVDANGNVLTTGYFPGGTADFNPGPAEDTLRSFPDGDIYKKIFISKLNANGNFVWVKSIEGINGVLTEGKDIITDDNGNVYTVGSVAVCGGSSGADFDPGQSSSTNVYATLGGSCRNNGFISKLDSNGNYLWHRLIGSDKEDCINAIAVDNHNNVYLTGYFTNTSVGYNIGYFPELITIPNDIQFGSTAMFVVKLNTEGALAWAKGIGNPINTQYPYPTIFNPDGTTTEVAGYTAGVVEGKGITFDGAGNVYTVGSFTDTVDFDPGPDTSILVTKRSQYYNTINQYGRQSNCFISKLDSLGNYVWAKSIGGNKGDTYGNGITLDSYNNVYSTGTFRDTVDFNPGTDTFNLIASTNCSFISKIGTPCNSSSSITRVSLCSNELPYNWNGRNYSSAGTFRFIATNVEGCDSTATLVLNVSASRPATPTSITQKLVDNTCGARIYRYTASNVLNASGYAWTLPTSVGGVAGVIVDSGDITIDRVIRLKFTSNEAAIAGDSIMVRAWSVCGPDSSAKFKVKLLNTVLNTPVTPYGLSITPVEPSICGSKLYRYTALILNNSLISGSVYTAPATGYFWSFSNTALGNNAVIDSGTENSRVIIVRYSSLLASEIGDSVRVAYTSLCGVGKSRSVRLTNTGTLAPLAPASLVITPLITNICGNRRYRYTAPELSGSLISGSASYAPVTGYAWSFSNTALGNNAVIDSGNVNSRIIVVKFTSNAAATDADSVRVAYTSSCGTGPTKSTKLTNGATIVPPAPISLKITPLITNVCGNQVYRYEAPILTTTLISGTATYPAVESYIWSFSNTSLGNNAIIDSGNVNSRIIVVRFTSLAAAADGDSVRVAYTSSCGNSAARSAKLTNIAIRTPAAPISIIIKAVAPSTCGSKLYRYAAPSLPAATATSGAASGWSWSFTGTLGSNAVIDSGDVNSQVILVRFTSNLAANAGDSVRVAYTSDCGNSANKSSKLTNIVAKPPAAPRISAVNLVTNVCGERKVRYSVVGNFSASCLEAPSGRSVPPNDATALCYNGRAIQPLSFGNLDDGSWKDLPIGFSYNYYGINYSTINIGTNGKVNFGPLDNSTQYTFGIFPSFDNPASTIAICSRDLNLSSKGAIRYWTEGTAPNRMFVVQYDSVPTYLYNTGQNIAELVLYETTGNVDIRVIKATNPPNNNANYAFFNSLLNKYIGLQDATKTIGATAPNCSNNVNNYWNGVSDQITTPQAWRFSPPFFAKPTEAAATGCEWSFIGTGLSSSAIIDSGSSASRVIVVKYPSNDAALLDDSVFCRYTSACGPGAYGKLKINLNSLGSPTAPRISYANVVTNVCGGRKVQYSVPLAPAETANTGAATGYEWSFVGTGLSASAIIESGTSSSRMIVVKYPSNTAASLNDSIFCRYTSACGPGGNGKLKIYLSAFNAPKAPVTITTTAVAPSTCGSRLYRYAAPNLTTATTTNGAASGWLWSFTGTLGLNAVIDSGDENSQVIMVRYTSNEAATDGDSIRVGYTSLCGNGAIKAQKLSNVLLSGCRTNSRANIYSKVYPKQVKEDFSVKVQPNPSTSNFAIKVKSTDNDKIIIQLLDVSGRILQSQNINANETIQFGSELKPGVYVLEVKQGKKRSVERLIKF